MFSCFAAEKKSRKSVLKDLEEDNKTTTNNNEDNLDINMDNLKKMDEVSLNNLKTKLNSEYRALLYENQINNDKIILYKNLIEEYKKNVGDEDDEEYNNDMNNYINIRNSIIDKEIIEMKNKNSDLHKEYLSLFESLSMLSDPYSKVSRLSEKIYILENKIEEQENKLKYLENRCKYFSNSNNIDNDLTKDIFLELFENKNNEDNLNLIEEKSSESSSSSSESSSETKEPINTIGNNVGDIKESTKLRTHNTIPKEAVEDYKRMLSLICKKNYEQVTKEYQKVISAAQNEILIKNNNLKKLELIKNEIEMIKDPSKKMKMLNEEEEKLKNMKNSKEKEKKKEFKKYKKIYLEKSDEYEELRKNLEILNDELKKEEEELNNIEKTYKENNESLNEKIEEGNKIQIELDEIKNKRDLLLIELFGNKYNNYDNIIVNKNKEENNNNE